MKVRSATSNDPWGPSGTQMAEIAEATFNNHDFIEIMEILDKRLNDKGKNWRHVFKALVLLDYCIHCGAENVVSYATQNLYIVKTLREFQHRDESGKDQGANIRQKAKEITALLEDDERLREARRNRNNMKYRMRGRTGFSEHDIPSPSSTASFPRSRSKQSDFARDNHSEGDNADWTDEDRQMQRAIAESKRLAAEQERSRKESDEQLRRAIAESEQESRQREENVAHQNELILTQDFDDQPGVGALVPHATASQQPADMFGALIDTSDPNYAQQMAYQQQQQMQQQMYHQQSQMDILGNGGYQQQQQHQMFSANNAFFNQNGQGSSTFNQTQYDQQSTSTFQTLGGTNPFAQTTPAMTSPFGAPQPLASHANQASFGVPEPSYMNASLTPQPATGDLLGSLGTPAASGTTSTLATAFDGGNQPKALPYHNSSTPNALIAEIARNSSQIDPFANLANSRASAGTPTGGGTSGVGNPFAPASGTATAGTPTGGTGTPSGSMFNNLTSSGPVSPPHRPSLLDGLDPLGSASSTTALTTTISQSTGFGPSDSKNPFATTSSLNSTRAGKPSLNQLMWQQQQPGASASHSPMTTQTLLTEHTTTRNATYSSTNLMGGGTPSSNQMYAPQSQGSLASSGLGYNPSFSASTPSFGMPQQSMPAQPTPPVPPMSFNTTGTGFGAQPGNPAGAGNNPFASFGPTGPAGGGPPTSQPGFQSGTSNMFGQF
ncbi:hypothetical protein H4R34_002316 [Dimargaris verticillata]|uniref:ENTH domain-containing protein n=1 Tax=Dimargaris verticillata TaxID=2761393 RepID=A0A9W8B301_9FUNG|nr:hypothetical protein H4R34_002316 [Dimargaris verticillata]